MKSDVVLGLQNASWPVLLVDGARTIHSANAMAAEVFGSNITGTANSLAAIWAEDNANTPAHFLSFWQAAPSPTARMKLRGVAGVSVAYLACIATLAEGEQNFFLIQLLPDKAAAENKTAAMDAGQAHKQKLDCALQLARTVSLDFNNALTSILGHTSLVLSKMEPNNPWRQSLMEVEKSAAKAAEIANDLGAFSRNEKETRVQQSGNLNQLLQRNVEMFQSAKQEKEVSWALQLERKLHTAKFDEAKMQQALVKIMENAIESLGPGGRIIIQTKNLELTQPTQDRNAQLAAGTYICAEITDNGAGIEAEILPRIFEPFFTTKRGTKHRGLGLAWVYGIVTNHGGGVAVSSQPGVGTSVRVYLPSDKKFVADSSAGTGDLNGTETILIVDDEDLVLTMGQAILSHYGYRVLAANSGLKALEIFSQNQQIDLLITDLVMPNMSGRELVEQVRRVAPFTRIICSSGYVRPVNEQPDSISYLQKPFTSRELLVKVKQALTSGEPAPVDG
ncbi:MAG TPA: ATP-binding protein [Verrucomicrobiae bacterium]|jgi:signal transduction histidine kinase|nr:ATP-binding protein [Verrucomicrobiae bacterium]